MEYVKKLYSNIIEWSLLKYKNDKTCSLIRIPDTFDGISYSIDEFNKLTQKYLNNVHEFFYDNEGIVDINLRKGEHFNKHVSYKSKYNSTNYIFDAPIKTGFYECDLVPFKHFSNNNKKSNTLLLFCPGGWRPNYLAEEYFCYLLFKSGIDVGLMTVPHQIERKAFSSKYSGEYFISANVFFTLENVRLFVAEIIRIIKLMRNKYEYIGLIGMSSGGFQSGIVADCIDVDFHFPFITGCKLGSITFNGKITEFVKRDLIAKNINEDDLNKVWSVSDQLYIGHNNKAKHIKHYISLFDLIVPTEFQYLLWEVYGKRDKMEIESGHSSSYFHFSKITNDMINYIKERTI